MGSFTKITGGVIVAAGALALAPPAQSSVAAVHVVKVPCSTAALSAAIIAANTTGGVLRLAPHCTYDITTPATVATGLPTITGDVTLVGGRSTTIRRDPAVAALFRILDVAAGARLRVAGITILNGSSGGLGGGIQNAGTLVLDHTTLSGNRGSNGGAVTNNAGGRATISRSLFTANATTGVGGGGAINFGVLTVLESVFQLNTAPINGGAINTQPGGTTELVRSTLARNTSTGLGGAISNLGTAVLNHTLVERNQGSGGGGIATGNTNVLLSNSTVRDNVPDNCNPLNTVPGCVD